MVEKSENQIDVSDGLKSQTKSVDVSDIFRRYEKKLVEIEILEQIRDSIDKIL